MISGLSRSHVEVIVASRSEGPFASLEEFARRTGLTGAVLERLSKADALASTGLNRRAALWQSLPVQKSLPLFDSIDADEPPVELPPMSPLDEVVADYQSAGLSLRGHPLKFLRPQLKQLRAVRACELAVLPAGRRLKVAGLVLLRQRPSTASGITFVTLEDETGFANLIVRPEIWERYHHVARTARAMLAHGYLQRQDEVIHVLVDRLDDLSSQLAELRTRSRDFR